MRKSPNSEESSHSDQLDAVSARRVWLKLDLFLLPVMGMFYFLSFLVRFSLSFLLPSITERSPQDRVNIGNARIAGLQHDLQMTNKQYSIALTVTYVPYILIELPLNLLLRVRRYPYFQRSRAYCIHSGHWTELSSSHLNDHLGHCHRCSRSGDEL